MAHHADDELGAPEGARTTALVSRGSVRPSEASLVPADPLDPTYSPSREGATPIPGPPVGYGATPGLGASGATSPTTADVSPPVVISSLPGDAEPLAPFAAVRPPTSPSIAIGAVAAAGVATGPSGLAPQGPSISSSGASSSSNSGSRASSSSSPQSVSSIPPMFVGRVLAGRWEVGQRIGLGGMASVHEGVDHRLGRAVAVKILHPHIAENPDSRERLAREARAIAQLKHENVIEVYDYSIEDEECTWLVTELIDGPSLRQILDRVEKPLPEVAVMIVTEVVRALRAAHSMGIVHRDVKPDNILVGSSGRPKLSDFGIAQVVNEHRMTLTGNLVGSPSYMSPEQANGKRTDHRTDLFSAGILLYRLVTGTLPFRGTTAIETIRKVSLGDYTDVVELEPGSAGAVAGIVRRSLSKNLEERYQTADQLLHDLAIVLQDAGLSATWEELPKFFEDPSGYQAALRPRLAKELETRGRALLDAGEEGRAVDCFNRALSLGEGNQRTLDLVRELSKRRGQGRVRRIAWATAVAFGAIAAVGGILLATERLLPSGSVQAPITTPISTQSAQGEPSTKAPDEARDDRAPREEANTAQEVAGAAGTEPARVAREASPHAEAERRAAEVERRADAAKVETAKTDAVKTDGARVKKRPITPEPPRSTIIAAGMPPEERRQEASSETQPASHEAASYGTLQVRTSVWADIFVDGKKLGTAPDRSRYPLAPGVHHLRAVHPNCVADEKEFTIKAQETKRLPLTITCP